MLICKEQGPLQLHSVDSHLTWASKDISAAVESDCGWVLDGEQDFGTVGLLIKITKRLNSVPLKKKKEKPLMDKVLKGKLWGQT